MKHITRAEIETMEKVERIHLINSINGYRSVNLIGSISETGQHNLAIFSSVMHLGSSPALLGFIMRPDTVARHTLDNIKSTGEYTINHVHHEISEKAHYTAAKFPEDVSEFDACGLEAEVLGSSKAPFVKEARIKLAMQLQEILPIKQNGTMLVIGCVESIYFPEDLQQEDGALDLQAAGSLGMVGVDRYYAGRPVAKYPFPRLEEVPDFTGEMERPDQVVYDEESGTYNASILPYATDQGAPSIVPTDLTLWKKTGASKISHHLKSRYEEIRQQFEEMKTLYSWNEMVYQAKFSFEPVLGETYHLYKDDKGSLFLSMIPPETWKRELVGSFRLNADQIWERVDQ